MSKTKHSPPWKKKAKPSFIPFTKSQQGFIKETRNRHFKEFNTVLGEVYAELGIAERILRAPPGTFKLREDYSGLDILPSPAPRGGKKAEPEKPAETPAKLDKKSTKETAKEKSY